MRASSLCLGAFAALAALQAAPSRAEYVRAKLTYDDEGTRRDMADVRVEVWQFLPNRIGIWTWRVMKKTYANHYGVVNEYIPYSVPNTLFALRIFPENYAAGIIDTVIGVGDWYSTPEKRGAINTEVRFDTHFDTSTPTMDKWRRKFNVIEKARHAFEYAHARRAPGETDPIPRTNFLWGTWPGPNPYFNPAYQAVMLDPKYAMQDMVVIHEYAHALQHWISTFALIISNHNGCTMDGKPYGQTDPKHAWLEGFANYFAGAVQRAYPDVVRKAYGGALDPWTLEVGMVCDLATGTLGETVESRVASALWDLADPSSAGEPLDQVFDGDRAIFEIFDKELDQSLGHWPTIIDFYTAWVGRKLSISGINRVFKHNQIEMSFAAPYSGTVVGAGNRCLDVTNAGIVPGALTQIWDCWGGSNQQWRMSPAGGNMIGAGSGHCFDVRYANPSNGERTQIWSCNGGPQQNWSMPWFTLRNDRCVQVRSSGDLELGDCGRRPKFNLRTDGTIRGEDGRCLGLRANGTHTPPAQMQACNGSSQQRWRIESPGLVRLANRCLAVAYSSTGGVGSPLRLEDCANVQNPPLKQRFSFEGAIRGLGGMCLDVDGRRGFTNGDFTQVWTCHFGGNQTWEYFP